MSSVHDDLARHLADAMRQEAESAMNMTDTRAEFERFQGELNRQRRRHRLLTSAAAACVALVVAGAVFLATRPSGSHSKATGPNPTAVPSSNVAIPGPFPAGARLISVPGPDSVVVGPGGTVWGTSSAHGSRTGLLFQVDPTGQHLATVTAFDAPDLGTPPIRVGQAVLVHTIAGGHSGYLAFDVNGRRIGAIPASKPGVGAGDANGGWIQSANDAMLQIDATGTHVVKTVTLRGVTIQAIAVGGGSVWVADNTDTVLRIDPASGKVTGHLKTGVNVLALAFGSNAVYATDDDDGLYRIDPASMRITAKTFGDSDLLVASIGPDGDVWVQPRLAAVADLDPVTLITKRAIQVLPADQTLAATDFGVVVTQQRIFMADGVAHVAWSFPAN